MPSIIVLTLQAFHTNSLAAGIIIFDTTNRFFSNIEFLCTYCDIEPGPFFFSFVRIFCEFSRVCPALEEIKWSCVNAEMCARGEWQHDMKSLTKKNEIVVSIK